MTTHVVPTDTDLQAITGLVATLEHAQQNESVEEFVSLFREDAIWTTGGGRFLNGRTEIEAFTRTVLPGAMVESTQTYEIVQVVFIRPDVVAVKVRQRYTTVDGAPIEDAPEGSPTYVMTKEDGSWLLVVAQNTLVADA